MHDYFAKSQTCVADRRGMTNAKVVVGFPTTPAGELRSIARPRPFNAALGSRLTHVPSGWSICIDLLMFEHDPE
ncbi:hypothetical protein [Rhizobium sp. Root1220]|uniref:hypothetical protein n=1 Tax=Rhizobium sp. Root1220 TaxID=1736432 RepID=UPI0006F9D86D|nr:hypothetical protein [Rhizobium sp. Root1220]KQV82700.1 hypothetical protein ASC90_22880 [Rhizobium sp. Root1220]